MDITSSISMDLVSKSNPPRIYAMQGDILTRDAMFRFFSGGAGLTFSQESMSVAFKKPDGTSGWYDTLPDGNAAVTTTYPGSNIYVVQFAPAMLEVPGDVYAVIRIEDETKVGYSFPFIITVIENPAFGASQSNDYYKVKNWGEVNSEIDNIWSAIGSAGQGLTMTEKNLILTLFKNTAYTADMSGTIAQLEALWTDEDAPVEPEEPDEPVTGDIVVTDDGNGNLTVAGVTAADDGNGNIIVTGATATDDGNGNVIVS